MQANFSYDFKVRAHNYRGYYSPFSQVTTIRTHADGKYLYFFFTNVILMFLISIECPDSCKMTHVQDSSNNINLFLVPSKVLNLNYEIVNETAVCLHWQAPLHKNGKLTGYLILYTPNANWPLDDWFNKSLLTTEHNLKVSFYLLI